MIAEIKQLTDQYLDWLRDEITFRQRGKTVEITAPFLDRHNDYIQFYAKRDKNGFLLTDHGFTIADLEMSGCQLDTPKRKALLQATLNSFGVNLEDGELRVQAAADDYARKKHRLLQAMLAVNDLFYLASPHIRSFFLEDIESWLEAANVRFTPRLNFTGASGLNHQFDFVIPKTSHQPERILLGINRPDRSSVERTLFAWADAKDNRAAGSRAYAILNDRDKPIADSLSSAYSNCGVVPVPWSERESVRDELAA